MAFYRLASQNRPDLTVDEVIFNSKSSEEGVEERKSISTTGAVELSDEELGYLRDLGYEVIETGDPSEGGSQQPLGADVAGMSPVIGQSGEGQPAISQAGMERIQNPHAEAEQTHDQAS